MGGPGNEQTAAVGPCNQAWHGGLRAGLLVECRFRADHRGQHRNRTSSLSWSGKLRPDEELLRDGLRSLQGASR